MVGYNFKNKELIICSLFFYRLQINNKMMENY